MVLVLVAGCAVDPVTGRSRLMLMSEGQEIALAEQNDEAILAQFGAYEDAAILQWVDEVGQGMAARAQRPHLPWTFRVLDDATVNAFTVGGGYVYLTRGILAWANSEAEIVGILGHEIGHVTARHIPERYTTSTLTQVGLAAGMVLSPEIRAIGGGLQQGLGLLLLKFSRDNESESDRLGVGYAVEAGYDARELAAFFATLDRLAGPAEDRLPIWASTHPAPARRATEVADVAAPLVTGRSLVVGHDAHLARIDGMVFGANPREGVVEGRTFKHPDLLFQVDFPAKWEIQNSRAAVVSAPDAGDAVVALLAEQRQGESLSAHVRAVLEGRGAINSRGATITVDGNSAYWTAYNIQDGDITYAARDTFVEYGGLVYDLIGYTLDRDYGRYGGVFEAYQNSFRRFSETAAARYQPDRLRIMEVPRDGRFDEFVHGGPAADLERLALLNGLLAQSTVSAGSKLKTVEAGYPRE
jgi:predicted Zn-dependent protease